MKKNLVQFTIASLFAVAIVSLPLAGRAADTNAPAAEQTAPAKVKKPREIMSFHGKLAAIDTNAMTFTVGKRTFAVTSETKINKDGKPATLSEAVIGESVGGAYKKGEGDKLNATTVHFGTKAEKMTTEEKPAM
jgi:Cu/Ag efflux protein CusF